MKPEFLSVGRWRCLLLVIVLCCTGLNIYGAFQWERFVVPGKIGTLPFDVGAPDEKYRLPILRLDPDNELTHAGAKVGDTIVFDHFGDIRRGKEAGEVVGLTWFTEEAARHVTVGVRPVAQVGRAPLEYFGSELFYWGCLFFAIVIGFRLAESHAMRILSIAFACNSLLIFDQFPSGAFQSFLIQTIYPSLAFVGYGSFTYFSLIYPEGQSCWRLPAVRRMFYLFAALFAIVAMAAVAENHAVLPASWRTLVSPNRARMWLATIGIVWSLASLALSWRRASGLIKQRLAWVGVCMGAIYATYFAIVADMLLGTPVATGSLVLATLPAELLALGALAYALLRYRLFDFGFVVNRALVATVLSTFLLIVFAITEFSVDKLLHFEGREKNVIFDAAVALAIILCFHRIQHWVNHKVDHTFFRRWYEAAEGLRRFLSKSSQITESRALQEKYASALKEFSGTASLGIFLARADGGMVCTYATQADMPAELDVNHDLLIDLRHGRQVMRLTENGGMLPGELALPMMTQGRLRGLILLGSKSDHQQYRPDEITLLGTAAQQLGMDLENLRALELESDLRRLSYLESSYLALEREAALLRQLVRAESA
jgi:GAF domain-containing protein